MYRAQSQDNLPLIIPAAAIGRHKLTRRLHLDLRVGRLLRRTVRQRPSAYRLFGRQNNCGNAGRLALRHLQNLILDFFPLLNERSDFQSKELGASGYIITVPDLNRNRLENSKFFRCYSNLFGVAVVLPGNFPHAVHLGG